MAVPCSQPGKALSALQGAGFMLCFCSCSRGKKRGAGKSGLTSRARAFGSREELDSAGSSSSKGNKQQEPNYNTRTRQTTKAQAMLARIQDKPPGTML